MHITTTHTALQQPQPATRVPVCLQETSQLQNKPLEINKQHTMAHGKTNK